MTIRWKLKAMFALLALATLLARPTPAQAGTIILEGSDAIGFHCASGYSPEACTYRDQVWTAIGGADVRPIAVIGSAFGGNAVSSGTHAILDFGSVVDAGLLSNYVALYFLQAGNDCCKEDDSLIIGNEAAVTAYLATADTTVGDSLTLYPGQFFCRTQDTVTGTFLRDKADSSLIYVELTVRTDVGSTIIHRGRAIKQ